MAFTVFLSGCANFPQFNPASDPSAAPPGASRTNKLEKELFSAREHNLRLKAQVAESAKKIETLTQGIRDLKKEISTFETTVERLRREIIIAKNFSMRPSPPKSVKAPKPLSGIRPKIAKKPEVAPITPQALYNKSYRAVRDGKNEKAIHGFRRFLSLFPNNQLAPHSQYWLGEAYYALRRYPEALDEFLNLITRYPNSKKVPDAYYKRGITYLRRKFPLNATLEFEYLVDKFPKHPLSEKAKVQLQNLEHYSRKKP
ncbi:MAG: tol-pal system protein YbgF [Nitrospinae bacterium]|nr:tol-pal system protein YbgF [Nitrospinota bacterium]